MLRAHGVVGAFVEFFGPGCSTLELADRATLSNMCPEYGATASFWPVDDETLRYLRLTGREDRVDLVERYTKEQGLFRRDDDPEPVFTEVLDLDLSAVVPSVAGPRRPQDRVPVGKVWGSFEDVHRERIQKERSGRDEGDIGNGTVVIAARRRRSRPGSRSSRG
jgi:aconitate hydratase